MGKGVIKVMNINIYFIYIKSQNLIIWSFLTPNNSYNPITNLFIGFGPHNTPNVNSFGYGNIYYIIYNEINPFNPVQFSLT